MAKFCTHCGKPLKDGKPCDCQKGKEEKKELETTPSATAKNYFDLFVEISKGIFTKPAETVKKYATKDNFVFACIAILLNSIVTGIFVYFLATEGATMITSAMGYGSLLSSKVEVSFMKVLLQITVFMLVAFLTSAVMIYVMAGSLFKAKADMKKIISLIGTCSIFTLITTVVAIIGIFLSIKFALLVIVIAGIFYLAHLYQGITDIQGLSKDRYAYTFVTAIVVASFVVLYILPKILF